MVARDQGNPRPTSPAKQRAGYAGVNLPAPKRGEGPTNVDNSFDANPERMAITASQMDLVRSCTLRYPKECQYLRYVTLHYIDGVSMADIALEMDVPVSTCKDRIQTTLNFLAENMGE